MCCLQAGTEIGCRRVHCRDRSSGCVCFTLCVRLVLSVPACLPVPCDLCRHGDELPLEIERLWRTLAHNRRNIIPMLDFLASLGTHMAYQVGACARQVLLIALLPGWVHQLTAHTCPC
jgi:hypothetical protein